MKTYVCKKATASSKIVTTKMIIVGIVLISNQIPLADSIVHVKPAKIFKRVWPAIMFAKSRIDKLNTRAIYEIKSIHTIHGAIAVGVPGGRNSAKKEILWMKIPKIFKPIKDPSAKEKVIIKELVRVKL